jgi:hypothetical protein
MNTDTKTAEQIADLGNKVMDVAETLSDFNGEDFDYMMLLDALAIHGYTIQKAEGENIASMAYMYGLSLIGRDE